MLKVYKSQGFNKVFRMEICPEKKESRDFFGGGLLNVIDAWRKNASRSLEVDLN